MSPYMNVVQAYFPPISQPEGLPLKIQDARGKEWLFQFNFWPNNNNIIYVLEGVTPFIQTLQSQASDTCNFLSFVHGYVVQYITLWIHVH